MMDGGTAWNFNVESAIDRWMELVDDESQIVLDTVICDSADLPKLTDTSNAMSNYLRARDIKSYYGVQNNVVEITRAHPKV